MMKNLKAMAYASSVLFLALIACFSTTSTPIPEVSVTSDGSDILAITPTPLIQHQNVPGELPLERAGFVGDQDSSATADEKRAPSGDRFTFNRFERPFNAQTMDVYYPHLDILETSVFLDETWVFTAIKVKGQSEQGNLSGKYAVELDLNLDGGGEWFVMVEAPSSTEWTVDGVEVWFDENEDVGGSSTMFTDKTPSTGNGYETRVFAQGVGDDPDLAWARVSPADPLVVQFAIKKSFLSGDESFMVNGWAGTNDLDPTLFDLSDKYTHDQAGTSLVELPIFYPIKELSELDNACRMPIGFHPTGNEPGLCPIAPQEQVACPSGQYYCVNFGNQQICYCIDN